MFPPSADGENNSAEAGGIGFRVVAFARGRGLGRLKVPFLGFKYLSAPFTDEMIMVPERDLLIPRNPVAKLNLTQHFRFAKECRRPVNRGNRCRRIVSLDFPIYFGNGYMPFPFEKMAA